MPSSLPKILETGITVFKINCQIIKNKKYYEISNIYTNVLFYYIDNALDTKSQSNRHHKNKEKMKVLVGSVASLGFV